MSVKKKADKTKTKKSLRSYCMRAFVVIFAVYSVIMLVDMQVTLAQRKQEQAELERQLESLRLDQKELMRLYSEGMDEDEVERIAREKLDYVRENEKVFVNNSGK